MDEEILEQFKKQNEELSIKYRKLGQILTDLKNNDSQDKIDLHKKNLMKLKQN